MKHVEISAEPVIRRPGAFLREALSDLGQSPPAAWRMFLGNMKIKYRRAWFGYLWLLLPALATAAIATFVQSRGIVTLAATPLPYPVFAFTGMILWQLFVEALALPSQQLSSARQIITRTRVPHEAVIGAGLLELGTGTAVRIVMLAVALAVFRVPPSASLIFLPLGIAALLVLGLSIGLILAIPGLLYDDVPRGIALAATFGLFLSPVLYPLPAEGLLRLNPVAPLIETARGWLFGRDIAGGFFQIVAGSSILLLASWLFYRVARPHLVARLG